MASSPPSPRTIHSATLSRRTASPAEGTLSTQPSVFRQRPLLTQRQAGRRRECLSPNGFARSFQLGAVAGVMPGDDGGHRLAASVEQDAGLGQTRHPEAADRVRTGIAEPTPAIAVVAASSSACRIVFRPRSVSRPRRACPPGRDRFPAFGEHDGLGRRGPDVERRRTACRAWRLLEVEGLFDWNIDGYSCLCWIVCQATAGYRPLFVA